jgi:hypothetical protein
MQMDSPNLPSQADLNSLYGAWNPMSYMQGYQNQALADQFRQQAFTANNLTNQTAGTNIANSQALLPVTVAKTQADADQTNALTQGQNIKNQDAGLTLAQNQSVQPDKIALLHAQIGREMSDEELSSESNRILSLYRQAQMNNNADGMQKYGGVLDTLTGAIASKAADRVQGRNVAELREMTARQIANSNNDTQLAIEGQRSGTQLQVSQNSEEARIRAAELHQNIANKIAQEYDKPPAQRDMQKIEGLTRILQTTASSWAGGVDVGALGRGDGLRPNVPVQPTAGTTSSGAKYTIVPTQ